MPLTDIFSHSTLKNGLMGFYPLNANTKARDWSGNGRSGTIGNYQTHWGLANPGKRYSCLRVAPNDDFVDSLGTTTWDTTTGLSAFVWANFDSTGSDRYIFAKWEASDGDAPRSWRLYRSGTILYASIAVTNSPYYWNVQKSPDGIVLNTWCHVGFTYDKSDLILYIDGVEVARTSGCSGDPRSNSTPLRIGTMWDPGFWQHFMMSGYLNDAIIHSRALTPSEITDLYNGGDGLPWYSGAMDVRTHPSLTTGLEAYWTMDSNLNDSTANARNGTFYNSPTFPIAKLRTGVNLNGSSQYGKVTTVAALETNTISRAFWFKADTLPSGTTAHLMDRQAGTNSNAIWIDASGYIKANFPDSLLPVTLSSLAAISAGTWYHLIAVQTATDCYLYLNGTQQQTAPLAGSLAISADIYFGSSRTPSSYFDGTIDEFGWWSKALSSDERTELRNFGYSAHGSPVGITWDGRFDSFTTHPTLRSGLMSHHTFDDTLNDSHGAYHATYDSGSPAYVAGVRNNAVDLPGVSGQLPALPSPTDFNTGSVSVCGWVKNDQTFGNYDPIVTRRQYPSGSVSWDFYSSNSNYTWAPYAGGWNVQAVNHMYEDGTWVFLVGVWDSVGGYQLLRVNNRLASFFNTVYNSRTPTSFDSTSVPVKFGTWDTSSDFFDGKFDMWSIFSRAITFEEIHAIYNVDTGLPYAPLTFAPVTNFLGTPGPRKISMTWDNPVDPGFVSVTIRRSESSYPATPTDGVGVYTGALEAFTDPDLDPTKIYYYSIFSYNGSIYSGAVSDDWQPLELPVVTDFAGVPGTDAISLSWTNPVFDTFDVAEIRRSDVSYPVTPVDGVQVYRGAGEGAVDDGLDPNKTYYYSVFVFDDYGEYSDAVQGSWATSIIPVVTGFTGTPGPRWVELSWTNPTFPEFDHVVVRSSYTSPPATPAAGDLVYSGTGESVVSYDRDAGIASYFSVFVYDSSGDYSNAVSDDWIPNALPATTDFAGDPGPRRVSLSWTDPVYAKFDKVMIRHSTVSYPVTPDDGTQIYWDSGESYEHLNLDPTLYHYYSIFAYDQYGAYAEPQADRWMPEVLPPVTGFSAVTGTLPGQISLSWTNPVYDGFLKVVLRRSDVSYPVLPTDGVLAYEGTNEALLDGSLDPTETYYYSIFAFDSYLVYSVRATAFAVPHENYARMTNVSVTAPDTIRVTFDQQMTMGTGDGTDVLYLANWTMETLAHPADPQTVTMVQLSPTIVQIVLDSEGTVGADYTIRVADTVTDSDGHLINPSYREITFSGLGQKPQVSFARSYTQTSVLVQFNEAVLGADVYTNYSIPDLSISSAELLDEELHQYRVYTSTQVNEHLYTVTVTGVTDSIGNPIDTDHDSWEFLGVSTRPTVDATPVSVSHTQVIIRFDMRVLHADEIVNYTIEPSLDVLSSEQYGDIYTYLLVTDPQVPSIPYTLAVSSSVTGLTGEPINPDHDTVSFYGQVNDPPTIDLVYPTTGTQDFPIRDMITVTAADAQRMKGIDEATWNITITRPLVNGTTETLVPVVNGELQPNFMGEYSGDPDSPEGVTWRLVPKGWWPTGSLLIVNSSVQDKEGEPDNPVLTEIGSFETGVAIYMEDMQGLTRTDLDTQLLTPLKSSTLRNCEALRRQVIAKCSTKKDRTIQARTLLYWSSRTAIRSTVLAVTDFSSLGTMRFGDRSTVADFYTSMSSFLQIAQRAVEELRGQDAATRDLLRKTLKQSDPLQVVSAMAAIAILGTFEG